MKFHDPSTKYNHILSFFLSLYTWPHHGFTYKYFYTDFQCIRSYNYNIIIISEKSTTVT